MWLCKIYLLKFVKSKFVFFYKNFIDKNVLNYYGALIFSEYMV